MVLTADTSGETLGEWLGNRALSSSKRRLIADVVVGGAVALAATWFRPAGWTLVLCVACCFVAYGTWAISEHNLADAEAAAEEVPAHVELIWGIVRGISCALGAASFTALLLSVVGLALGTIIS